MVKYAGTLTVEDLAQISHVRDRWMEIGLSTERCDRPRAEAAVHAAYVAAGLAEPPVVIWMDSPLGGAWAAVVVKTLAKVDGDQLRDQLGGQLGDQLGDQLRGQLRGQLGDQLWDQLWDQLRDQLWGQLRDQLGDQLWGQLGGQLWEIIYQNFSPWWDAYWLAFYSTAMSCADLSNARLTALVEAQEQVGWWWPMQGAVVLTDRPTVTHCDPQGRLHCEDGPALLWADGYTLHSWHGTTVPADLIEGTGWDTDRILREDNAEVRRCAIERRGWDWFVTVAGLSQVGATVDDPGNPGQVLSLYDVPEQVYDEPVRVLLCANGTVERDGTRHRFGLTVPGSISDPVAAAGWTFGLGPSEYRLLERAT